MNRSWPLPGDCCNVRVGEEMLPGVFVRMIHGLAECDAGGRTFRVPVFDVLLLQPIQRASIERAYRAFREEYTGSRCFLGFLSLSHGGDT